MSLCLLVGCEISDQRFGLSEAGFEVGGELERDARLSLQALHRGAGVAGGEQQLLELVHVGVSRRESRGGL
jgi:hypothetical protein